MTEIETINCETVKTEETIVKISIDDFKNLSDETEESVKSTYRTQIETIDNEDKLPSVVETLKGQKAKLNLKKNSYQSMITGRKFNKEYWDSTLKPYFDLWKFPYEIEETQEIEYTKNSKTNTLDQKEVTMIRVTNNIKDCEKNNLIPTLKFIIENYNISDELRNDFISCLESLSDTKEEQILKGHVIKANSDLYKEASTFVKKVLNVELTENKGYLLKVQASIDFINWKLKQIKIYENEKKLKTKKVELAELHEKIQSKLIDDKKFSAMYSIVEKYNLTKVKA